MAIDNGCKTFCQIGKVIVWYGYGRMDIMYGSFVSPLVVRVGAVQHFSSRNFGTGVPGQFANCQLVGISARSVYSTWSSTAYIRVFGIIYVLLRHSFYESITSIINIRKCMYKQCFFWLFCILISRIEEKEAI